MLPDDKNELEPEDEDLPEESEIDSESSSKPTDPTKRKRVRIKVRKKIRIKKKPSAKKMIRKVAERAFWTIIILGFIASLIIMIVELDIRDERLKQQRKKSLPTKSR